MLWAEPTCWALASPLGPLLSEKHSVEWQLDAYVDHLGEETHLANFTYHGHRLHLLTDFLTPCIICTIEPPCTWNPLITNELFFFPPKTSSSPSTCTPCFAARSNACGLFLPCLHVFTVHSGSVCVPSYKMSNGMSSELEILFRHIQGLSVGRATVTFLYKWIKRRRAEPLHSHTNKEAGDMSGQLESL